MKRRIISLVIATFILLCSLSVFVFAEMRDVIPSGYKYPDEFFKLENGLSQESFGPKNVDGVYMMYCVVKSDYIDRVLRQKICLPNSQFDRGQELYEQWEKGGFFPTYETQNLVYSVKVERNGANDGFTKFVGHFQAGGYIDGPENANGFFKRVSGFTAEVELKISNIVYKDYRIYMDIEGFVQYQYSIDGDIQGSPPGGWTTENTEEFRQFRESIKTSEVFADTRREFSKAGAESMFYLDSDGKTVKFKIVAGEIVMFFDVIGVLPSKGATDPVNPGVTQNAGANPGEDSGVSVPAAVVIGVAGGGVAVVAAAAAIAGTNNSGDGDDKKKKSYKMYVQKDFGDGIRRGGDKPVVVRARMAEVDPGGAEHDRNDLTAKIGVSTDGMTLHSATLAGRYCEATVSVPKEYDKDTANITFTFMGEGGSFTNTVVFRIVDGPSIKFINEDDGTFCDNGCGIEAIPGDGFTYKRRFMVVDAPVAPGLKDITAVNTGEFDVTFELTDQNAVYMMIVVNNTKPEPEHDLFAKVKELHFELNVVVEGEKEPIKGYVTMEMYPEGITVQSRDEGKKGEIKYVYVQAYEKENVGDLDKKWQVSEMQFTLAHKGKDKAIIDPKEAKYKFEKLKGSGGKGMRADKEQCLAEKYEYKESYGDWNGKFTYTFEPNANLSEPDNGKFMMVLLPTSCEYDGQKYEVEVPLRLRGKDPDPMQEWEKEYKELERRIEKYSLPENKAKLVHELKMCALDPKASVQELRLTSKWILREWMEYWTTQQKRDQAEARMYNIIVNVLEWTKFLGDCAFSFLVNMYAGPVADALISPAKDFITSAFGEVIAAVNHGETLTLDIVDRFEFSKNLAAAGDNLLSNNINLTNWKKAAATLSAYFVYCAVKNYVLKLREENVSDVWGAICEAFKDMTFGVIKSKAGELIGKWVTDSKKFQEKILPYIQKYFKETQATTLQHRLNDALGLEGELRKLAGYANDEAVLAKVTDVVEKYIGNLVGEGFDKVRECYDSSKFTIEGGHVICKFNLELFDTYKFGIRLDLTTILMNVSCPFYGWLYDLFFKGVPCAASAIEAPKDPPLPPAQND